MRWLNGRLEFLDITDIAHPKVLGAYPAQGKADFSPKITVTDRDYTWVLAPSAKVDYLVCIAHRDLRSPTLVSKIELPGTVTGILPEGDYVYLSGPRSFGVLDVRQPEAPKEIAALDESSFVGQWKYSFMEDQPRVTVVAGKDMEGLNIELKDGHTVWLTSAAATYAVDVADPRHPRVTGGGPGFGESWWVRSDESDLVSIGSYRRLFVDIANPAKPRAYGAVDGSPIPRRFPELRRMGPVSRGHRHHLEMGAERGDGIVRRAARRVAARLGRSRSGISDARPAGLPGEQRREERHPGALRGAGRETGRAARLQGLCAHRAVPGFGTGAQRRADAQQ
jgi:hypothetical protein